MPEEEPRLYITDDDGIKLVELTESKILDELGIAEIGRELGELIAQTEKPKIVVDFVNVAHMSSSALGMLITLHKRICEKDGQLRLCEIRSEIYEVFVITRLNEIFRICESRDEAIESLK